MWLEQELNIDQILSTKEKEILYSLLQTASLFSKYADKLLLQYGLTESQYKILELIYQNPEGMTQVEISGSLLVNRSNITGLVDRLEKSGYVVRGHDPKDRRINRIKLKEKARKILKTIQEPYLKSMADICKALSKDEMKTLGFLLEKINKPLIKYLQTPHSKD